MKTNKKVCVTSKAFFILSFCIFFSYANPNSSLGALKQILGYFSEISELKRETSYIGKKMSFASILSAFSTFSKDNCPQMQIKLQLLELTIYEVIFD